MGWIDTWIDKFIKAEFASGKDPPEERKSKIKKLIREELNKNPVLSNVLKENKAEGKFIKELTDRIILGNYSDKMAKDHIHVALNSKNAIDRALHWMHTKQGFRYWDEINDIVIDKLSK